MQVSVETTGGLTRKMTIAVPSAEIEGQIADRVRSTATKVALPGFRRGRVPLKEVERRFGTALRREVASEVVQSSLEEAVRREELPMIGMPSVELVNIDPGADLEFTATFEVLPDIQLVDPSTLTVRRPDAEVRESDIDEMVESLRRQRTEWNAVERPAGEGDRVMVDYAVKVAGAVVEGGQREDFAFVVGASETLAELDVAVAGMSRGETRAFPITINHDHGETSHEVEAVGEVFLKAVEEAAVADLDDTFFQSFGVVGDAEVGDEAGEEPAHVDVDAAGEEPAHVDADAEAVTETASEGPTLLERFRDNVRERMTAELEVAARSETKRQVMATLARAHRFEIPQALLSGEIEQERQRMSRFMGVAVEETRLPEPAERLAEERVRTRLVVREIVDKESLKADDGRIRERIDEIVAAYEEPDDVRNWIYGDESQLERIELGVLEDQLVDHILSKAVVESVPCSYKEVLTGTSIPALAEDAEAASPVTAGGQSEAAGDSADGPTKTSAGRLRRWFARNRS